MTQLDFSVIKSAGIPQGDFASLCGVSRITVNLWVRGRMSPNRFVHDKVAELLHSLSQAVERGRLPLPPHQQRAKDRLTAVAEAITPGS